MRLTESTTAKSEQAICETMSALEEGGYTGIQNKDSRKMEWRGVLELCLGGVLRYHRVLGKRRAG